MRCINVIEGEDFALPQGETERLREAMERLRIRLKPSFSLLSERTGTFRISNVIGTVDLGAGLIIQISPKVPTGADWTTAVVSLLSGKEGIDIAGERQAGTSQLHNKLLDAVSGVYLTRLERAFRQEGPILLMEQHSTSLPYLQGKLNVTKWARSAFWRPHIFPVVRTELAQDNPFTRGLLLVAEKLASASTSPTIRNGLRTLARDLGAGFSKSSVIAEGVANRKLPEQWSAYTSAWSLATSVLSNTSLLGPTGQHTGVGLAIEAWPLLETLLERTLQSIEGIGQRVGRSFTYRIHGQVGLLKALGPKPQAAFSPEPDGRLYEDGKVIACFEAKYSTFDSASPQREHTYQALSTAAACGTPIAVLIYPNSFDPQFWEVSGFGRNPQYLIAIGLDLFSWFPAGNAEVRGKIIFEMLNKIKQLQSRNEQIGAAA